MFNQTKKLNNRLFFALLGSALTVILDQTTKWWWSAKTIVNPGVAFSWFHSEPLLPWISLLFLGCVFFVSWRLLEERSRGAALAYGILLGGGFSNLVDRFLYNGVRDIWYVPFLSVSNNLADWCIFGAVLTLVVFELRHSKVFTSVV